MNITLVSALVLNVKYEIGSMPIQCVSASGNADARCEHGLKC